MKNKLSDLNNHLFAQLERLGDEDLSGDKLNDEINRARAVTDVASQVIANANIAVKVQTMLYEYGFNTKSGGDKKFPPQLREYFTEEEQ